MSKIIRTWRDEVAKRAAEKILCPFELQMARSHKRPQGIEKVTIKGDGGVYVNDNDKPEAFIASNEEEAIEVAKKVAQEV